MIKRWLGESDLDDYFVCLTFGVQQDFEGPGQVGQGELVGDERPKPDRTLFDQAQSYLEIPTISTTSADLDFLLGKEVDREMDLMGLFK
jgi:hypothetical protein